MWKIEKSFHIRSAASSTVPNFDAIFEGFHPRFSHTITRDLPYQSARNLCMSCSTCCSIWKKLFGVLGLLFVPVGWEIVGKSLENRVKIRYHGGRCRPDVGIFWFCAHYISRSTLPIRPKFVWELPRMLVSAQNFVGAMGLLSAPGI